jgi:hypothetical protein
MNNLAHPYHGIQLSNEKERAKDTFSIMDKSQNKDLAQWFTPIIPPTFKVEIGQKVSKTPSQSISWARGHIL